MKLKIGIIIFFILSLLLLTCKKDDFLSNTEIQRPNNINELKSSADFSFQNSKHVSIHIEGTHSLPTTVKSDDGNIYFNGLVTPNNATDFTIVVPSNTQQLLIQYGDFSKTVIIVNNRVDAEFNLNNY